MSNVVGFLEMVGRDASMRRASPGDLESALMRAQIDPALQAAILRKDQNQIAELLGANANVCCILAPEKREEEEEEPSRDDDEVSAQYLAVHGIASAA